jgi:hypothetical protein
MFYPRFPFWELETEDQIAIRQEQSRELNNSIGRTALRPNGLDPRVKLLEAAEPRTARYLGAADIVYSAFLRNADAAGMRERYERSNVRSGFQAISRIMSHAPGAYKEHTQEPSLTELDEILRRPGTKKLVDIFAATDNATNRRLEMGFGLRSQAPAYEEQPFVIQADPETGLAIMAPSPDTLIQSRFEAYQSGYGDPEKHRRCPAIGRMLGQAWDVTLDLCVQEPELFPADLGLVPAAAE